MGKRVVLDVPATVPQRVEFRQRTGSQTAAAQEAARVRFAQLLAALENKPKEGDKPGEEGGGAGSGGQQSGGRPDGNQVLTQLKLLKILQEDLNGRYRTLTEPDAGDDQGQLGEIAAEQGRLAELALKLASKLSRHMLSLTAINLTTGFRFIRPRRVAHTSLASARLVLSSVLRSSAITLTAW